MAGFDVGALDKRELHAIVKYAGESIRVSYSAGSKAHEFEKAMNDIFDANDDDTDLDEQREAICAALCEVLTKWDVNVGGEAVPLKAEAMSELPVPSSFFGNIARRLNEEMSTGGKPARGRS